MKCQYVDCGYVWKTTSKLKLVTCPSCQRKTPNRSPDVKAAHAHAAAG